MDTVKITADKKESQEDLIRDFAYEFVSYLRQSVMANNCAPVIGIGLKVSALKFDLPLLFRIPDRADTVFCNDLFQKTTNKYLRKSPIVLSGNVGGLQWVVSIKGIKNLSRVNNEVVEVLGLDFDSKFQSKIPFQG